HRRQRRAAFAVQHPFLHDRGERAQVCPRVVAGADSQPPPPVQVVHPGDRAAAVHRADGALRNRVLVDLRFPVLGRELDAREDGPDRPVHRFSRRALARAAFGDRCEHLAGRPVRGDFPAGGAADHPAVPVRGILDRRRDALAAVLERHAAAAHADHRGGDDLQRALHVHGFPAHLRAHARRAAQRHSLDGDARVPARHPRRRARRRRRAGDADGAVSAGGDYVLLLRIAAPCLAAGRQRQMSDKAETAGMEYLQSLPRRWVTLYVPIGVFLFVLLFPFYWMVMTSFKSNEELMSKAANPFWIVKPTLDHFEKLLFRTEYPQWLWNTILISVLSTFISLFAAVLAAYAIERLRFRGSRQVGLSIFFAYLVPPSILFIPLALIVFKLGLFDSVWALILTYPTFLIPFCTWLLMGYFRTIPYELEECALIDGATRWQILVKIMLPLAVPGLISAGIFAFTLSWNEFIYALTFISSSENKTVPVDRATAKALADLGKIDVLVNNAGIAGLNVATADYPVEEWERVLRVNLTSQFLCCRVVAPHMVKRKYGRIVNIASIAGKEG